MKVIKYFLLLIIVVFAGMIIYISITGGQFQLEREISIQAPQSLVFQEINNLKNWGDWVRPSLTSAESEFSYTDKTTGEKAGLQWESREKNKMSLTNKVVTHNTKIKQQAEWKKGLSTIAYTLNWTFHRKEKSDSTRVNLTIRGSLNFWAKALQIFSGTSIQDRLAPKVDKSLVSLKAATFKKMTAYSIHVDGITKTELTNYIYKSVSSKNNPEAIAKKRKEIESELKNYIAENYLRPSGNPFVLYNHIDKDHGNAIISIGIPIGDEQIIDNPDTDILLGTRWPRKMVKSTLKGAHKNLPELWSSTETYLKDLRLTQSRFAKPYEVFIKDISDSENPADWVTSLYIPLATPKEINQAPPAPASKPATTGETDLQQTPQKDSLSTL